MIASKNFFKKPAILLLLLFSCSFIFAQKRVTGNVLDADNNPLSGATVTVTGTTDATQTDKSGDFSIMVPQGRNSLTISYVGTETQTVDITDKTVVNVSLKPAANALDAVVVVGYGVQKKATLAGSIAQVSGTDLVKSPAPNLSSSLQGRLPGLTAVQRSGQPGRDDASLLIRGAQTLGNSGPLIVVDGVQGREFSRLNPEDIESVTVLKDASAAIYGARGANGVLLVTTKNGSRGKAEFNFSYRNGFARPTKVPDVLDAATFAEVYNEGGYYRAGRNASYWNNPQYTAAAIQKYRDGSDPVLYPNTDWVSEVLKTSSQENMNLSVNGGNDKIRYLLSFGTVNQTTSFRADPTFFRQYNGRIKIDIDLIKNLVIGANVSANFNKRNFSPVATESYFFNILRANPAFTARYPNGLLGPGRLNQNPLLMDQRGYDMLNQTPIYSTFTATYKLPFVPGLKFEGSFNYDINNEYQKAWLTPYFFYEYNTLTGIYERKQGTAQPAATLTATYRRFTNMMYNVRATYDKVFQNKHHVYGMIGVEQQQLTDDNLSATRRNYVSGAIDQINAGSANAADLANGGSGGKDAYDNYFGRFNYDFRSKYIFEFIFRYDGSPRFLEGKRYGFFPGLSGAWRISEEDWFKTSVPFVNELKVRATYGELGNDRIAAFQYFQFFGFGGDYVFSNAVAPGLTTQTLPNPAVSWERAKKTDIGVVANLWNGKLGVDLTLWKQKRTDILVNRNLGIPNTMGYTGVPPENYGEVNSRGYELALTHRSNIGQLAYTLSGNIAYSKSDVVEMDEVPPAHPYQNATGKPLGTSLYYKTDGIFNTLDELNKYPHHANSQVGDLKIVDMNGDGVINDNDRYRHPYTSTPRYIFGLNSDFQFKSFDLNIFFQGQAGAYTYDATAGDLGLTDFSNAAIWRAQDRWTEANPNATQPRSDAWQPGNTDFFLFNATFIRLKTVEIGYTLPASLLQKTRVFKGIRVFANGFNLATWSKDIKWADPELNNGYLAWPPQRIITFGATLKF